MDTISNANHATGIAYLQFQNLPDGRFVANYELMGLMEGLVTPSFLKDHFQLNDFTPFHDEIRSVTADFLVGKYMTQLPPAIAPLVSNSSLGLFHTETGGEFGFYYMLTRATQAALPTNTLLSPFLDVQLPDGVGMNFDEEMVGWYFPGASTSAPGREGDLAIAARIPASGDPAGAVACNFTAEMSIRDVNEFVDGYEHEAQMSGPITFGAFGGHSPATFTMDASTSTFNYLRVNPQTGEAEMRYHFEFADTAGTRYTLEGVKYMQKNSANQAIADVLGDYTTLYTHIYQQMPDGTNKELGIGYMKFRTFENLAAVSSLAALPGLLPHHGHQRSGDSIAGSPAVYRLHGAVCGARIRSARLTGLAVCHGFPGRGSAHYGMPAEPEAPENPIGRRELGGNPSTSPDLPQLWGIERVNYGWKIINIRQIRYCTALRPVIDSS